MHAAKMKSNVWHSVWPQHSGTHITSATDQQQRNDKHFAVSVSVSVDAKTIGAKLDVARAQVHAQVVQQIAPDRVG